mmetsp:Transcript_802/g.1513  ORF Transcript_802/g.1513 Transcript_802/m.1513 type:complete len:318 (-) Transcript_802:32-985(-)
MGKKRQAEAEADPEEEDEPAPPKKSKKRNLAAEEAEPEETEKVAQKKVTASKEEAAARTQEKAEGTKSKKKQQAKEKLDLAARQARNKALKQQNKQTRSQKYKERLKAKKAESEAQKAAIGGMKLGNARLEEEALKLSGLESLDPNAKECFLTGLPFMATESHVATHFSSVGDCRVSMLWDDAKGRSSGKAFVTFNSAEAALRAATYNGTKIQNRWITVRLCEPREGSKKVDVGPGTRPEDCYTAIVTCDTSVSEASLWKFFEDCEVSGIKRMLDKETGEFRGMAFLDFEDGSMVDKAVKKSGSKIKGKEVLVRYKR